MQGFIKLHRQIIDWEWYTNINVRCLFIHCLLRANHAEKKWQGKTIQKGSFVTSYENLAVETGLSIRQIRTALDKLKMTGEVTYKSTSQYSIITINNWDKFQLNDTQNDKPMTNGWQTDDKQMTTNKNDKNNKNEKNIYLAQEKKLKNPFESPYVQTYQKVYKEVFNKRCYLLNEHRTRLIEIASELGEKFEESLYIVFRRLKFINFEDIKVKPDSAWLLSKDNFIKVLEGTFGTKEKEEEYVYNAYN